jgi:predicted transcriptional regulator
MNQTALTTNGVGESLSRRFSNIKCSQLSWVDTNKKCATLGHKRTQGKEAFMPSEIIRGRVSADLRKDFLAIASDKGLNESAAINLLVRQFVDQEKELKRRNEETMEALADVTAGLVVDGKRVLNWLASWGTEDEKEVPE